MTNSEYRVRNSVKVVSFFLLFATCYSLFVPPVSAEPCPAAGCATGQYCARDSRLPDGSACYVTCTFGAPETGCGGGFRCINFSGEDICVFNDSPLIESDTVNPRCDAGRTCPTDRTYVCASGECLLTVGQRCERSSQCQEDAECVATSAGGTTCNARERSVTVSPDGEVKFEPITPTLGVEIPGGSLSAPTKEGDYVVISFLGQYINAIYRYAVTIVLIAAIVMVVYGGFRYLVGASIGDIQAGKKIIIDALMGMLIVLGAYMILNTVNPDTVNFKALSLISVERVDVDAILATTKVDTVGPDAEEGPGAPAPIASYDDCPLELTAPSSEPANTGSARRDEFKSEIDSVVTGATTRLRVIQIAEAASKCGVWLGSCGKTAETIYELAGSAPRGRQVQHEPRGMFAFMDGLKCETYSRDCTQGAARQVYDRMQAEVSGWPRSWTNELQPGDVLTIYNANSAIGGLHRMVFMGWDGSGKANVVDGAYSRFVRGHLSCINDDCPNPWPVIRVFRPSD